MKVKELMTQEPKTCTPDTTVSEAAHLMWEADCGILPVVDRWRVGRDDDGHAAGARGCRRGHAQHRASSPPRQSTFRRSMSDRRLG